MKFLKGKKTIIGAIAIFLAGGCMALGLIDQRQFEAIVAIMGAWTAYGLHDAIINQ